MACWIAPTKLADGLPTACDLCARVSLDLMNTVILHIFDGSGSYVEYQPTALGQSPGYARGTILNATGRPLLVGTPYMMPRWR